MEKYFLSGRWDEVNSMIANARLKVKSLGLWAPHLPKSIGGTFTGLVDLALFAEVLGQSPLGHITFGCQAYLQVRYVRHHLRFPPVAVHALQRHTGRHISLRSHAT